MRSKPLLAWLFASLLLLLLLALYLSTCVSTPPTVMTPSPSIPLTRLPLLYDTTPEPTPTEMPWPQDWGTPPPFFRGTPYPPPPGIYIFDERVINESNIQGSCSAWVRAGLPQINQSAGHLYMPLASVEMRSGRLIICNLGQQPVSVSIFGVGFISGWSTTGSIWGGCWAGCENPEYFSATFTPITDMICAFNINRPQRGGRLLANFTVYPHRPNAPNLWHVSAMVGALKGALCPYSFAWMRIAAGGTVPEIPTPTREAWPVLPPTATNTPIATATPVPATLYIAEIFPCQDMANCQDWNLRSGCGNNDLYVKLAVGSRTDLNGYRLELHDANGPVCSKTFDMLISAEQLFAIYADEMMTANGAPCFDWPRAGTFYLYDPFSVLVDEKFYRVAP